MKLYGDINYNIDIDTTVQPFIGLKDKTPIEFFNYNENELMEYLESYPYYDSSKLYPADTTGMDFDTIESYKYQSMYNQLPKYLLYNVHGFYIEHIHYFDKFLKINFGDFKYLLRFSSQFQGYYVYYSLELAKFISLSDIGDYPYRIIENFKFIKWKLVDRGLDINGYPIVSYELRLNVDISQFVDRLPDISEIPTVPYPNYTQSQINLMPSDYLEKVRAYKTEWFYDGTSKNFYRMLELEPFRHAFKKPSYPIDKVKAVFKTTSIVNRFPSHVVLEKNKYGDEYYRVIQDEPYIKINSQVSDYRMMTYNFFNPYEWFFIDSNRTEHWSQELTGFDGDVTYKQLKKPEILSYAVYRYRKPLYEKYQEYSKINFSEYELPESELKKCCLMECFGITE